ncbi:efflux transporter outer membrane subunit [Glaciimonas immobilis]|uniref:NodT family efflux transporter outer membrane factor (OMF) lipoprotein n=1 Tax=Glaciimonas immobilis TaxID=728004 RepID=A0A840RQL3_9BURK|nr:efflux transporter outer membrane subunit [Glaciimonas immobilis]KAF3998037.1 efflux transporter outer membrane subunit [Glaciimonas immobilis]MBB5199278.1 NodT family efflux transporter outer membrane factor (OMF) lipoprotein [Glaciimonas immobilis]
MKKITLQSIASSSILAVALALTGCTVGPDFKQPDPPAVQGYTREPLRSDTVSADTTGGTEQQFVAGMDIPAQWWTLFQSAQLNAVIAQAIKASPDLQSAQAALRAAEEQVAVQRGSYFPAVDSSFSPARQKVPTTPIQSETPVFNLYTTQVNVSYSADVFGGNRRQAENLIAQARQQRFQLEAAYLTLTANVVAAAVQEASLRVQISATEEAIRSQTTLRGLLQRQYALGDISQADVAAQAAAMAQTQATLPPLQNALSIQRNRLTALTGRLPSQELEEKFVLSQLQLPQQLPVSLPSNLVRQRPDVRTAEEQLHAASAAVGVATANMLPQITLTANIGSSATQLGNLFAGGTGFWALAGSVTQPLFAGGALLHKKRAAEAVMEQASAQYRSTVILAFQNVADSLRALQYDAQTLKAQLAAERAASKSLEISRKSVQLGASSPQTLLTAQLTYQLAVINLAQAQAARFADTAALFQALGGGWWNRTDDNVVDGKLPSSKPLP